MSTASLNVSGTIAAAIVLTALMGISLSLYIPLLSLEMERAGISSTMSGLNTAVGGLGTLLVVPHVPRLAARIGVQRLILGSLFIGTLTAMVFVIAPIWSWFPLRFVFGGVIGALFVLSEYWINAAAPPDKRGLVMGIYATMLSLGFALGPTILLFTGTSGVAPYLAGASLFALAAIPLLLAGPNIPNIEEKPGSRVLPFMVAVPAATFAALTFGAIETGGFALLPVYGLRSGFSESGSAALVSWMAAGNVVTQIPLGLLADRVDRRRVLLLCATIGVLGCILMPLTITTPPLFYTVLFVWGGFTGGLYTVGLAHLGARFHGHDLASANAAFVMLYSTGLILGPPFVGVGMDAVGPNGFAFALGAMLFAYATLVLVRLTTRRGG